MGGSRRILLDWQKDGHKLPRKYMDKVIQAIRENDLEAYKVLEADAYNTIKGPYQLWALTLATIVDQLNRRNDYDTDRSVILRESLRICPDSIKQYNSKEISGWSSEHPLISFELYCFMLSGHKTVQLERNQRMVLRASYLLPRAFVQSQRAKRAGD